ncbi:MAG TPA: hypothetical protein PKK12_11690 [Candidatus Aminicenantes bacterium]|nr:hypothetical protein [Candidatus Aminicenantes bacterium]
MFKPNLAGIALLLAGGLLSLQLAASGVIPQELAKVLADSYWVVQGRIRTATPVAQDGESGDFHVTFTVEVTRVWKGDAGPLPVLTLEYRSPATEAGVVSRWVSITGSGREYQAKPGEEYFFLIRDRFLAEGRKAALLRLEPMRQEARLRALLGAP